MVLFTVSYYVGSKIMLSYTPTFGGPQKKKKKTYTPTHKKNEIVYSINPFLENTAKLPLLSIVYCAR
jgi:hypothetical protein